MGGRGHCSMDYYLCFTGRGKNKKADFSSFFLTDIKLSCSWSVAKADKLRMNQIWFGKVINLTITFLTQRLMWENCRVK